MSNTIQQISDNTAFTLDNTGKSVGKDGKYSVQEATTILNKASTNLNTLDKIQWKEVTAPKGSNISDFVSSLWKQIQNLCHNLVSCFTSSGEVALNTLAHLEQVTFALRENKNVIKDIFDGKAGNDEDRKKLRDMRDTLYKTLEQFNKVTKDENWKRSTVTKTELIKYGKPFLTESIGILMPNFKEECLQAVRNIQADAECTFDKVKSSFQSMAKTLEGKLPSDQELEEKFNQLAKSAENAFRKAANKADNVWQTVKNNIKNFFL